MHAPPFYTCVLVCRKCWRPDKLKHKHYRPLHHSVAEWQLIDYAPLAFNLFKNIIFRNGIFALQKLTPESCKVFLQVGEKRPHLLAPPLALGCPVGCLTQIFKRTDTLEQIAVAFHRVCGSFVGSLGLWVCICSAVVAPRGFRPGAFRFDTGLLPPYRRPPGTDLHLLPCV